jgi:hypothetical protein
MLSLTVAVLVFCAYLIVSAIVTAETTGVLKVSAAQKAHISVTSSNSQAENIGKPGNAQVRLKPGTYQVVATASNGEVAARTVLIEKKRSVAVSLSPAASPKLPSVNSVSFFGTSALTDLGISPSQIDMLKLDFFHFKTSPSAVNIDSQSVQTLPHKLGDPFVITFDVTVDSKPYKAKITYSNLQNILLQLYNPQNGQLVYDSSQVYDSSPGAGTKNTD